MMTYILVEQNFVGEGLILVGLDFFFNLNMNYY